ncbi:hypothetical protein BFW01_g2602 [Lasiodiplodia theobromae]|uniref:Mitochondrial adapter protein MCP1 transmembrane domain-containing protein n=1 Tax=Lasiodiplodia theobromae TaxID=45133 RepID=A0A5N5DE30_9PEZI|nr:Dimethylguanosine tRNA methyltransferase [Lasiodiplodia theobromae]KAB2575965.1 hypothetical protein DBV05_g5428 [Lasiodiplodia theobromae]KAF4545085.1 Dimethylguanosine tRNA methyltransferase [Lasiodiplodia theobromae]KAF9631740.1 hypothetical protein BFW01_g2602 [Lasiodiplodia theobromae]
MQYPASDAASVFSLELLEPSPVDDTPYENEKSYFPDELPPEDPPPKLLGRSTTLGLSGRGPAFYLTRIQKYSSYAFSVFAAAHITNTALIPLATRSIAASDTYLLLTRPYYQDFPFEPLLVIAPLVVHVGSGIALRFYRRRQTLKRYAGDSATFSERRTVPWPKLSGTSALGYMTTLLVGGHAFANRILPLWVEGSSAGIGLEYVSHAFARHPGLAFAGFSALVSVTVWHSIWGWAKWLNLNPASVIHGGVESQLRKKRRWYLINALAAAVTGTWLWGGIGVVGQGGPATGWVAKDYDALFKSIPYVGEYL